MDVFKIINKALEARQPYLEDIQHQTPLRLFNGFREGYPDLVIELYARSVVVQLFETQNEQEHHLGDSLIKLLTSKYQWIQAIVLKERKSPDINKKKGSVIFGSYIDNKVIEDNVWYTVDLQINQDTSFYIDNRNVRKWIKDKLSNKTVLNTFAYTGSLGVAAIAGKATHVVQTDRNKRFLNIAKHSYALNRFPIHTEDFLVGDFFQQIGWLKRMGALFDCVILDPPLFSIDQKGTVNISTHYYRLLNKVRPLVKDGGIIIAINNGLFVRGIEFIHTLEELSSDGYLYIDEIIPVPEDCIGYAHTIVLPPICDPSPFNHSTKIAVLRIKRK